MTDREPPEGYRRCDVDVFHEHSTDTVFWLEPQFDWEGTTPLFMVCKSWPGGQTTIAERCYLGYGKEIVDALRLAAKVNA